MVQRFLKLAEQSADFICGLRRYPEGPPSSKPKIIAHRGAWDLESCFENTMRAFEKAAALGAEGIEFDVHFTKDGVPVVHHDGSLDRIFANPGVLENMTLKDLRSVTADVPTFEEVLALKGLHFMIELKVPMTPAQIVTFSRLLEGRTPVRDYHLLAIEPHLVREHSQMPGAAWILVGELDLRSRLALSLERGYGGVAGHYLGMTRAGIGRLHEVGQIAGVGFVPNRNLFNREWSRGVDFVFTNTPAGILG